MKAFTPWLLVKYISKEFSYSLFIMFSIIFSLLILTGFVSELTFFSEKNLQNNIIIESLILALFKIPSVLTETMPFIFYLLACISIQKYKIITNYPLLIYQEYQEGTS